MQISQMFSADYKVFLEIWSHSVTVITMSQNVGSCICLATTMIYDKPTMPFGDVMYWWEPGFKK